MIVIVVIKACVQCSTGVGTVWWRISRNAHLWNEQDAIEVAMQAAHSLEGETVAK